MKLTIDTRQLDKTTEAMKRYGRIMPTSSANSVLRRAVNPMYRAAKAEVPVSKNGQLQTSIRHRGKGKAADSYSVGGATLRDLRVKTVPPKGGEIGRILVGVSKRANKVGWRTVFITAGTKQRNNKRGQNRGRVKANNFLQRAYDQTISLARSEVFKEYREAFLKWGKANLPQDKL